MNKIFTPFNFFIILFILVLGSIGHLMYGHCQTSKYHFMTQVYYMPDNLPRWLLKYEKDSFNYLFVDKNYSGKWSAWYRNGIKEFEAEYKAGNLNGNLTKWYENGAKKSESEWLNGRENGKSIKWDDSGRVILDQEFKNGEMFKDNLAPIK